MVTRCRSPALWPYSLRPHSPWPYLPWPDLLWLYLLWATVPAQRVCLIEVAEPEVVAYPRDAPIDLRIIGARVAIATLLVRAGLGSGSGFASGSGSWLGSGLGLGSGSGLGSGLGQCL